MHPISRHFCLLAISLTAAGCREIAFPVPPQRARTGFRLRQIIDIRAGETFPWASAVSGVMPVGPGLDWSWTDQHPAFLFKLDRQAGWDLELKLTTAGVVLNKTGPQHLTMAVNGKAVGSSTLDRPRTWLLRFPVDPVLLPNPAAVRVTLAIDPCLPQPGGPPACVLLHQIGFTRALTAKEPAGEDAAR